jgi:inorganic phosphate transporter, PiT family
MHALIALVCLALIFDYINGFHDAANSIATVVSTRVLTPRTAVVWAAFFNFVAFLFFETKVAGNIAKGVHPNVVTLTLVAAGLVGAIVWDLITWWLALPTSSSHALLGGLAGAAITKAGIGSLDAPLFIKTGIFIILSPAIGLILGSLLMKGVMFAFGHLAPNSIDRNFRKLQLVSAALYSIGHGGNDAQKTAGIITAALIASGYQSAAHGGRPHVPVWVVIACFTAMGLGTLTGGWRIVRTMGMRITKLAPVGGFCAETSGAISLFIATALGVPVSTTHTITGSIVGTGTVQRFSAVRWGVAGRIIWAWILTVPGAAFISAATYYAATRLGLKP